MGRHSIPGAGDPSDESPEADGVDSPSTGRIPRADAAWQGRRRKVDGGRRGVSVGVVAALVTVVVLVGGIILWRFFGHELSKRSDDAAQQCLQGTATVSVVADPSIAESVASFADSYNDQATPVGDKCVKVTVTTADSAAAVDGLTGTWPADLGERPALWIPASSIQSARLQAAAGKQIVSDARSLVTSPVVLAMRPQLKDALAQQGWPALPGLQSNPAGLDGLNLPGWGSLRLALPADDAADATYLTVESVATTSAPPGASPTAGLSAAGNLLAGRPRLADDTTGEAWKALTADGDPAAAPVHAVAMTEQQVFRRTAELPDAKDKVAAWLPAGPVALADYPTVLLSGPWLADEQLTAASEFARYMRKDDQLARLAEAGFRTGDATPEHTDVLEFGPLGPALPAGEDLIRATLAATVAPGRIATTTIVLNEGLVGDEDGKPRLSNVTAALRDRITALPPGAAVGLWTFNRVDSGATVPTGPLTDQVGNQQRAAALAGALDGLTPTSGGGVSFTTLRNAYGDALANFRPGQPNSILVVTQGPHTDQSMDAAGLQDFIKSAIDPNRPVAVNVIDFGGDPDRQAWEAITALTGGGYTEVPASDSPELTAAVARMLS